MVNELIFATGNEHKVNELADILFLPSITVRSLKDMGYFHDIPETGDTLEENALIKARTISKSLRHYNVFSEDTGLEVTALDMAPGVNTARYAGESKDAYANMSLLLKNLEGKMDRTARFRTVIALLWEGQEYLFEGIVNGKIANELSGDEGFGYDPIFIPEGYESTFANIPPATKNTISHRYNAVSELSKFLKKELTSK